MKTTLGILLFAATSVLLGSQRPTAPVSEFSGMWQAVSADTVWRASLRADGSRLVGAVSSCSSNRGEIEIFDGRIDRNVVTFKCRSLNGLRTVTFVGVVNGDEITFTWDKSGPGDNPTDENMFGASAPRQFSTRRVDDTVDPELTKAADHIRRSPNVTFDEILHADREPQNWLTYSGNVAGSRSSPLSEITPRNVHDLQLTWVWQAQSTEPKFEATPLAVNGVLYTVQPPNDVVALDATTGRVIWTHPYKPDFPGGVCCGRVNRGLAILGGTLFMGTLDAHLLALDAYSGELVWDTQVADAKDPGCNGLHCYAITHAPLIVKNKVLVGVAGGDSTGGGIRGFVAAFDAANGKEVWRFTTIPAPGEPGGDSWSGNSWQRGGAAVWNTGTFDSDLNLTYWGTGNPNPTHQPETRLGDNLYSDSVVALDADTGALKWHYQFNANDQQDWDAGQVPVLADIEWQGRPRRVMLWAGKNGVMYVLDRATGQFLLGKPFVDVNWMTGFDRNGRPLLTATITGTDPNKTPVQPYLVGTNWWPQSYDPSTKLFYIPAWSRAYASTSRRSPGHGAILAFDPRTGEQRWEFRRDDAVFTGVLTTASGLLFTGTWGDAYSDPAAERRQDGYFYALDAGTGRLLWEMHLPGSINCGPMTYARDGTQYIAIAAGNTLFAFTLRP